MPDPSPVPAVTRDQVLAVISTAWRGQCPSLAVEAADAVMALLAEAPQPKVLNHVETRESASGNTTSSVVVALVKVPPGSPVLVVEAPASKEPDDGR